LPSVLEAPANHVIRKTAEELKKNPAIKTPDWVLSVKSGVSKERLSEQEDFWFMRCASLLRSLYIHGNKGVRRLRHKYGGKREHSVSRAHHAPGGGKIIRVALQQLEAAGLVRKEKTGGRVITNAGIALLNKAAAT